MDVPQKLNIEIKYIIQQLYIWVYISKKLKSESQRNIYIPMVITTLLTNPIYENNLIVHQQIDKVKYGIFIQ